MADRALVPFVRAALGPALLGAIGLVMAAWTWLSWPDALVDYGREVYLAWRLAQGEVLYRDLAHFGGPLSPALNAASFRLFGPGIATLSAVNGAWIALLTLLFYRLLREVADRFAATVGCAVFLVLFAFPQLLVTPNYNFVSPYSHELTHGVLLGVAAIGAGTAYARRAGRDSAVWAAAATGLCLGLTLLTKPEIVFATAPAVAVGAGLVARARPLRRADRARDAIAFGVGLVAPALAAVVLLATAMPVSDAWRGLSTTWRALALADLSFYQRMRGTDDVARSFGLLLGWSAAWAGVLGAGVALARLSARRPRLERGLGVGLCAFATLALGFVFAVPWLDFARPYPVVLALLLLATLRASLRDPGGRGRRGSSPGNAKPAIAARFAVDRRTTKRRRYEPGFGGR